MGFEFKSDQPEQKMVDTKVTLSTSTTPETTDKDKGVYVSGTLVEENLTQMVYEEGEEERLAIQFIEENGLYSKFLLWQGIQEQLKKLREELA